MNSKINEITDSKTVAKKSLPAKYNQLLVFGYWFLNHQKSNGKITPEVYDDYISTFHIFDGIESQMQYLDNFFSEFKLIHKNLKNDIREKNKKPKTKKKKEVDPNEPPKKRGRKKKEVVDNRTEEQKLIDEIVASAQCGFVAEEKNQVEPIQEVKSEFVAEEKNQVEPIQEVKSEIKWIVVGENTEEKSEESSIITEEENQTEVDKPTEPEVKKKRGRPRKERKIVSVCADDDLIGALLAQSQRESELNESLDEDSDSEEEIEVRKFINNDILYLIDDNNNIYDHLSHDIIGKWNDIKKKIDKLEDNSDDDQELSHESYNDDSDDDKSELYYDRSRFTDEKLTQYDQNRFKNNKYGRELYIGKIFDIRKNGMYCTKAIQKSGCVLKIEGGCLMSREEFQQLLSKPCEEYGPRTREFEKCVKVEAENYDDVMLNIYEWEEKACAMNHSCNPNAYIVAEDGLNRFGRSCKHFCVYALKDIPNDTEITIDYGWSANNFNELKFCKCGSDNCRGVIHNNGSFREKSGKMYKQFQDEEPVFLSKCQYMPIFDYDYLWSGEEETINHQWEFTDEPDIIQKEKSKPKRGRKRKFQYIQTVGHMHDDEPYGNEFNNRPTRNITMYFENDGHIEKRHFRRDDIGNVFNLDDDFKINSIWMS
jgi:hypothetical protein